jgi:hypothetical protein
MISREREPAPVAPPGRSQEPNGRGDDEREDPSEVAARRLIELLNEVRVALPGVQILLAFLLTLPFTSGFGTVPSLDRSVYAGALLACAVASALFISVSAEHRLRWRRGDKPDIVEVANRATIWGLVFLAVGVAGAMFVVLRRVMGPTAGALASAGALIVFAWFWFALPLIHRRSAERRRLASAGRRRSGNALS